MNPHLAYGQAVPGLNDGRGFGIMPSLPVDVRTTAEVAWFIGGGDR
jgi:hypothetical protein